MFLPPTFGASGRWHAFAALLALLAWPASAQAPHGNHLQFGPAGVPGVGLQAGVVSARDFFTREINVVADLSSFRSDGDLLVAAAIGGSIRALGSIRTIGNAPYRGVDLDLGLRIGPGLVFNFREGHVERNRRFNLFLEPFVRGVIRVRRALLFAEAGAHRPVARLGAWIPVGR